MNTFKRLSVAALCFAAGLWIYPPEPAADVPAKPPAPAAVGCIDSESPIYIEGEKK